MNKIYKYILVFAVPLTLLFACGSEDYTPKERTYFRITLPEVAYQSFDTTFPYSFEYSKSAKIFRDERSNADKYWINVVYPMYNAILHISYKEVNNNLSQYFEDSRIFANKQMTKATGIKEKIYYDGPNHVYGLVYDIKGTNVASTYQFVVTDSTKNFLRGALYFDMVPNNDSLAPVIDYIKKDIDHLINTFRWKKTK